MTAKRLIVRTLALPALGCCLPIVACAFWIAGVAGGILALAASLTAVTVIGWMISRNEQAALTRMRQSERRRDGTQQSGVFERVLAEASRILDAGQTEYRQACQAKTEAEARLNVRQQFSRQMEGALNCLESPVWVTDGHGKLRFRNSAAGELLQTIGEQSPDGSTDYTAGLVQLPDVRNLLDETLARNAATDRRTTEFELDLGDGPIQFRAIATNVYGDDHSLLGAAAVLQDIREEYLEKTRHAEFVSAASHELKTPLTGIKGYVEMLKDGDVSNPDEQQELYEFIESQVDRLTRLINNMLNLSRIESGVIKVQREDLELNDVLHKAIEVIEPSAEEKQIDLLIELSQLYLPVHVDRDLFGQAVINLLSNAVKYTPNGGEVRLRSRMQDGEAVIEVRDTGLGIPADALPHIFERFYRVPENNKAAAGTGLGLTLVHDIVTDVHNGTVSVESTVNRGTCFTVQVPLGHRNSQTNAKTEALCTA